MMLKTAFRLLSIICLSCLAIQVAEAQTLPVGLLDQTDDLYRRQQLLGKDTSHTSFMIRPLVLSDQNNTRFSEDASDVTLRDWNRLLWSGQLWNGKMGGAELRALPVVWQQQVNSHHPYGWNDGMMIPAKGYQTLFSAGVYAKLGPLRIQLRPEVVYAQNSYFSESLDAETNTPALQTALRGYHNSIDAPERFGDGSYSKAGWGQSSIRLNFDPVSFGLSNENLWWGPGVRNSLLMSNNAPGFKHFTLNTTRPVHTPIGAFEAQLVAGRLEGSGIAPKTDKGITLKRDDWRYLSGFVATYQPKWVPGLFLGLERTYTTYRGDMGSSFGDYFPVFTALEKKSHMNVEDMSNEEDQKARDQIFSLFARWVMPESHSEIYFQYGREDHSWDLRDVFIEPEHSRAYVAGFKKLIPLNRENEFIETAIELTQTEPAGTQKVRGEGTWYNHGQVRHGYTHHGQFLGAGIGPDNMQSLDVNWVKGMQRIGLLLERRVHNNRLYYVAFDASNEFRRHWVDFGIGAKLDWEFGPLLLNSRLVYTNSLNYQYEFKNQSPRDIFIWDKNDVGNLHLRVGLMYRW